MYATGIGLVLYGFNEIDDMRQYELENEDAPDNSVDNNPKFNDSTDSSNPDELNAFGGNDIFADMPQPSSTTQNDAPVFHGADDIENDKTEDFEPKSDPDKGKRRFGHQVSKAIEKYFNKVFNDGSIRNEGRDETEL